MASGGGSDKHTPFEVLLNEDYVLRHNLFFWLLDRTRMDIGVYKTLLGSESFGLRLILGQTLNQVTQFTYLYSMLLYKHKQIMFIFRGIIERYSQESIIIVSQCNDSLKCLLYTNCIKNHLVINIGPQ